MNGRVLFQRAAVRVTFDNWLMGRMLIYAGIFLIAAGLVIIALNRIGFPLGRLPGDFSYRSKNMSFFAPIGTCILLSIVLSIVMYLISHLRR